MIIIYDTMLKINNRQKEFKFVDGINLTKSLYDFIEDNLLGMEVGEEIDLTIKLIDRKEI